MRSLVALVVALLVAFASSARAQNCTVGCPCGNACISCQDTCRIGGGDARAGDGAGNGADNTAAIVIVAVAVVGLIVGLGLWYIATNTETCSAPAPSVSAPVQERASAESPVVHLDNSPEAYSLRLGEHVRACARAFCGDDAACFTLENNSGALAAEPEKWLAERSCKVPPRPEPRGAKRDEWKADAARRGDLIRACAEQICEGDAACFTLQNNAAFDSADPRQWLVERGCATE